MMRFLNLFQGWIQGKTRILFAWFFVIGLGFFVPSMPWAKAWPGVFLCFLGASLRYWASGYLRKDKRLAVGGPYAFSRNPLYLGTYLMAVGSVWMINHWLLLSFLSIFFAGIYHFIILAEEKKLQRIFHKTYTQYCQLVPRFFPSIQCLFFPVRKKMLYQVNPESSHHHFSFDLAMKNKAYEAYAAFFGILGWVWLMLQLRTLSV